MDIDTKVKKSLSPSIVTVGVFDGVHTGHQKVLRELINEGDIKNYKKIVFTFKNHPLSILNPDDTPTLLTTFEEKVEIISSFSIDQLIAVEFDREFSRLSAEDFIRNMLIHQLNMKELVVGYDASMGRDKKGNLENLIECSKRMNYSIRVLPPEYSFDEIISSSLIRNYLLQGNLKKVCLFLGRPFQLSGYVIRGEGRGKKYGFPTANLFITPEKVLPLKGVYSVKVFYKEKIYPAIMNIGNKPTFGRNKLTVEVNIFNFNQSIYGQFLKVEILDLIREERVFSDHEELYTQIRLDIKKAREITFDSSSKVKN